MFENESTVASQHMFTVQIPGTPGAFLRGAHVPFSQGLQLHDVHPGTATFVSLI